MAENDNRYLTPETFLATLKQFSGPYTEYALRARLRYINLRRKQDKGISSLYVRSANRIAAFIRGQSFEPGSYNLSFLVNVEQALRDEAVRTGALLNEMTRGYIEEAVDIGVSQSKGIAFSYVSKTGLSHKKMEDTYFRINTSAVEAIYARAGEDGLFLSDRIWSKAEGSRAAMSNIVQEGVTLGMSNTEIASQLQQYVKTDNSALDPELREKAKSPKRISYEAMRLARTETAAALGEGAILANRAAPSYKGMKWTLSASHPKEDVCDELANADFGLGRGVYPNGQEPRFPAHPNCICSLLPVHTSPEEMIDRVEAWLRDPDSDPDLEAWAELYYY